jgi:hypothetical protein
MSMSDIFWVKCHFLNIEIKSVNKLIVQEVNCIFSYIFYILNT